MHKAVIRDVKILATTKMTNMLNEALLTWLTGHVRGT